MGCNDKSFNEENSASAASPADMMQEMAGAKSSANSSTQVAGDRLLETADKQQSSTRPILSETDLLVERIGAFLERERVEVLFEGSYRRVYQPHEEWGSMEFRLRQSEPTEERLLSKFLREAERAGQRIRRADAKDALGLIKVEARDERRVQVGLKLFASLSLEDEQAVQEHWARVAKVFASERDLCVTVIKHFMWLVKRGLAPPLVADRHLMPIITSPIQGSGKTTFVQRLLEPLSDLVAEGALLSDLVDPRSADLFGFPVVFVDDVGSLERRQIEVLKSVVTSTRLNRRQLGTSHTASIARKMTLIGTANRPVDELIVDKTGNRRFVMLPFQNGDKMRGGDGDVWQAVKSIKAELLWRSIDAEASSPLTEEHRAALHKWQESSRPPGEVEAWLDGLDVTSPTIKAITTNTGVKAKALYEVFRRETGSDMTNCKFGTELTGLAGRPGVPFGEKKNTRQGAVYPIQPAK